MTSHSTRVPRNLSAIDSQGSLTPNLTGKVSSCILYRIFTENVEVSSNVVPRRGPLTIEFVSDCMPFRGGLPRFGGSERHPHRFAQLFL